MVEWPGAGAWAGSAGEPPKALAAAVSAQRIRVSAVSGVLAVGLRDAGRAAPHAVCADGGGDRPLDLPGAGFIGALQWRC
jgi:hypothetical protein